MSHIRIMVHCVWSTKDRFPFFTDAVLRNDLFRHIENYADTKGITLLAIGGFSEHVHVLLSLGASQTVARCIQLLKGESSFWMHTRGVSHFQWQDGYFAVSISEGILPEVMSYIACQETHHRKRSFREEVAYILRVYGFDEVRD